MTIEYSEQGLNDLENEINDLQRQLAEEKKDHEISFKCSVDYQNAYEEEKKKLAEAREENDTLINKNILLAEGNSILMQQLKEKGDEQKRIKHRQKTIGGIYSNGNSGSNNTFNHAKMGLDNETEKHKDNGQRNRGKAFS